MVDIRQQIVIQAHSFVAQFEQQRLFTESFQWNVI